MNVVDGRRQSAADAYLRPNLGRENLTIVTDAHVTRLVFDDLRCRGADYTIGGVVHRVEVDREVVVCAGAVGTPHLLMLSGIGPVRHLREVGLDVLVDAPGVGQNLHDHRCAGSVTGRPLPCRRRTGCHTCCCAAALSANPIFRSGLLLRCSAHGGRSGPRPVSR